MIFSSHIFILFFLPVVLTGYFTLSRLRREWPQKLFLVCACLFFYAWFNPSYLPLILASIAVNYALGRVLFAAAGHRNLQKTALLLGIVFNLGLLGYYKYADFFITNLNALFRTDIPTLRLLLPLGISFFTFQQLAYLVDIYKGDLTERYNLLTYSIFVTFFPQLIAGPIVLPNEMMPQFACAANRRLNWDNVAGGFYVFAIGLAKKMMIADFFGRITIEAFNPEIGSWLGNSWAGAFAFSIQMYFDFSGYCDMAIGLGLMFNIKLPVNFDSPYKSASIAEFWKRWHITLGRFLMTFVYFPLGGSRCSMPRKLLNLLITFTLCGLWHGAGWVFLIWGFLHGLCICVYNLWKTYSPIRLPKFLGVALTFSFMLIIGLLFSSQDLAHAGRLFSGLVDFSPESLRMTCANISTTAISMFLVSMGIIFFAPNAVAMLKKFKPGLLTALYTVVLIAGSILCMSRISPFLYFNF